MLHRNAKVYEDSKSCKNNMLAVEQCCCNSTVQCTHTCGVHVEVVLVLNVLLIDLVAVHAPGAVLQTQ